MIENIKNAILWLIYFNYLFQRLATLIAGEYRSAWLAVAGETGANFGLGIAFIVVVSFLFYTLLKFQEQIEIISAPYQFEYSTRSILQVLRKLSDFYIYLAINVFVLWFGISLLAALANPIIISQPSDRTNPSFSASVVLATTITPILLGLGFFIWAKYGERLRENAFHPSVFASLCLVSSLTLVLMFVAILDTTDLEAQSISYQVMLALLPSIAIELGFVAFGVFLVSKIRNSENVAVLNEIKEIREIIAHQHITQSTHLIQTQATNPEQTQPQINRVNRSPANSIYLERAILRLADKRMDNENG